MLCSFPYGKHCFQGQFLFPRCKLCVRYTPRNFNENPSMRARAREHLSNFCEQFQQRPNFASTFKFDETIRYPQSSTGQASKMTASKPGLLYYLAFRSTIPSALQATLRGFPSVFSKATAEGIISSSISVLFYLILGCCDVVSTVKLSQCLDW